MKILANVAAAALLIGGGAMLANGAIPRWTAVNAAANIPVAAEAAVPAAVTEYAAQPVWAQMIALEYCNNIDQLAMGKEHARTKAFAAVVPLFGADMRELPDAVAMTSIDKAAVAKCGRAIWG